MRIGVGLRPRQIGLNTVKVDQYGGGFDII
jgi:hypothetical protein